MKRAIGVFDSGLGGLTVLRELRVALPAEDFIYLGDTARLPYGSKSLITIRRYAEQNINYLCEKDVKALVVACNSASAAILATPLSDCEVPVFEVITPGAKAALAATQNHHVAVLGTNATIQNQTYKNALMRLDPKLKIESAACPLLVPLVEEGWLEDPLTNLVIHRYTGILQASGADTYILGCTHYPALEPAFRRVLGSDVRLINSGRTLAEELRHSLAARNLLKPDQGRGAIRLMITDQTSRFHELATILLQEIAPTPELVAI